MCEAELGSLLGQDQGGGWRWVLGRSPPPVAALGSGVIPTPKLTFLTFEIDFQVSGLDGEGRESGRREDSRERGQCRTVQWLRVTPSQAGHGSATHLVREPL